MAGLAKKQVMERLEKAGVIPVFYHEDLETCKKVMRACHAGGVTAFEYTNRGEKAGDIFPLLKMFISISFPGMLLGMGTVLNETEAELFIQLGADFLVSPILSENVAAVCKKHTICWIPGCATPTEIARAESLGAGIIKVFPGSVLGPKFIKSVLGPMPWLKLMPTGGVEPTEESLKAWFGAGAAAVAMGTNLITRKIIEQGEFDVLTATIQKSLAVIQPFIHDRSH